MIATKHAHPYETLLLAYAAGALDEAQSLIVASHIALSQKARHYVSTFESIGGLIIEKHCPPVRMHAQALDNVLARIGACGAEHARQQKAACMKHFTGGCELPEPLAEKLETHERPEWHEIDHGLSIFDLILKCKESHSRFLKMAPGLKAAPPTPPDHIEITLVLDGGFEDDNGYYTRGDMAILERARRPHTMACRKQGCVSLVVTSRPLQVHGIEALIRPFV